MIDGLTIQSWHMFERQLFDAVEELALKQSRQVLQELADANRVGSTVYCVRGGDNPALGLTNAGLPDTPCHTGDTWPCNNPG